jgi:hypothetical protein
MMLPTMIVTMFTPMCRKTSSAIADRIGGDLRSSTMPTFYRYGRMAGITLL